jgi:proline iminopeptidase
MKNFSRGVPSILLALVASCDQGGSPPDPGEFAAPIVQEGYVESSDGVSLFYRAVGDGADTVVVLHGGPGLTLDYFADDLLPLAERSTLIFYDQRGTGRSTLVSDSAALAARAFGEDLEAVRNHFGLEQLTLLGHSWGAGVAAIYAQAHPERVGRLLLVGSVPVEQSGLAAAFDAVNASRDSTTLRLMREWREARVADPGDAAACRAYYTLWFIPFFGDTAAASRSKGDFCAGTAESRRNKMVSVDRYTMASLGAWDWRLTLRRLTAPALIIHGTADVFSVESAREWVAALPNARLLLLEGVGHFPYLEAPETFFAAAEAFIRGGWPAAAEGGRGRPSS